MSGHGVRKAGQGVRSGHGEGSWAQVLVLIQVVWVALRLLHYTFVFKIVIATSLLLKERVDGNTSHG